FSSPFLFTDTATTPIHTLSLHDALPIFTPNHLNRTVKEVSGRTASSHIAEMLLHEAKVLLKYTNLSVAEIAYRLQFSEPSSFNRDRKSTRLNSSHRTISYAVFCLKKKKI